MVKTPNVRHSKSRKDPVTIDLAASRVPPEPAAAAGTGGAHAPESSSPPAPDEMREAAASGTAPNDGPAPDEPSDSVAAGNSTASNEALLSGGTDEQPPPAPPGEMGIGDGGSDETAKADLASGFGRDPQNEPRARRSANPSAARSGRVSAVVTGLIGGAIALVGAAALQYAGVLPAPDGDAAAVERLQADMTRLQSEIAAVQSGATGGSEAADSLQSRIDQLATGLESLRQAVEAGGAGENAGLAALDTKIADLETQLAQIGQNAAGQSVDLGPLNEKIAALEAQLQAGSQAAGDAGARIGQIEQTLSGLMQTVSELARKLEAQGDQPKIALSIAASALKAAIDRGQPFTAELETLAAISPNLPQLEALRTHAEAGVATREDLVSQMDGAANAMIAADEPPDQDAGYLDELWDSAASLVTVRPVGSVEGDGVPEIVARMEAALKEGDLAKALAEYATLPDSAKVAGQEFAARIQARLDVETLADQAIAEAMKTV